MKAFIFAAGLGTRLRPFTEHHPKALVPVGGVPMLERVMLRLRQEGFDKVIINVHHFADQIEDFLAAHSGFGLDVLISDERGALLDTGGALLHARGLLDDETEPLLIHNVDILSDAPLAALMDRHAARDAMGTLLVSRRDSSRRLIFGADSVLRGWTDLKSGAIRPSGFHPEAGDESLAFSGIHVVTPAAVYAEMERQGRHGAFPIMDFYLEALGNARLEGYCCDRLRLIDIGKPATLAQADSMWDRL
ncbi:MAG: NTP transferase domain-containing protein [Muribaculaceae bacterium]|nr:NTP transferase domain-containing protein [Muribaculaceae bacterium]